MNGFQISLIVAVIAVRSVLCTSGARVHRHRRLIPLTLQPGSDPPCSVAQRSHRPSLVRSSLYSPRFIPAHTRSGSRASSRDLHPENDDCRLGAYRSSVHPIHYRTRPVFGKPAKKHSASFSFVQGGRQDEGMLLFQAQTPYTRRRQETREPLLRSTGPPFKSSDDGSRLTMRCCELRREHRDGNHESRPPGSLSLRSLGAAPRALYVL